MSTEDIPVWRVYNEPDRGPAPVLVGWYNLTTFLPGRFLTFRTFGTEASARDWIEEFWRAYWAISE